MNADLRKAVERMAWELYCKETAGSLDVRDFWFELSPAMQSHYIARITAHLGAEQ